MTDDARLDRIEHKVDRLAETMSALVRVEERVTTIFARLDLMDQRHVELGQRQNDLERENQARLTNLERTAEGRGYLLRFGERLFWIIVTAGVAIAFAKLKH